MKTIHQTALPLVRHTAQAHVPNEMVHSQRTHAAAFTLACSASGLEDKEIYLALGIDAGYFSNIKKGKATLQSDLIGAFCKVVANLIYPEWIAFQVGCTLVMIQTEAERRAAEAEARAQSAEAENRLMRQLLAGKVTG